MRRYDRPVVVHLYQNQAIIIVMTSTTMRLPCQK